MSVPRKYRAIGDFYEYYSGNRRAPYLTLFVGGNHEASSYLQELYYGGWVAPKIYYLGAANVIRLGNLRIAGLSGIWKGYNYNKPHFERLPYTADEIKSLYHVRETDVRKLLLLRTQTDVGISHDWPRGIEWKGDHKQLFRFKEHLERDAQAGTLGNTAARFIMDRLRPRHWFSAHLHCKYNAVESYDEDNQTHGSNIGQPDMQNPLPASATKNTDEIDLDLDDEETSEVNDDQTVAPPIADESTVSAEVRAQLPASFQPKSKPKKATVPVLETPDGVTNKTVKFLALDKCLPNRKFLEILEIHTSDPSAPKEDEPALSYDPEWLAILRTFASNDPHAPTPFNEGEDVYGPQIEKEEEWVASNIVSQDKLTIPENFEPMAPYYDGQDINSVGTEQPIEYTNPQTVAFCKLLDIPNWFGESEDVREERRRTKAAQIEAEARAEMEGGGASYGRGRGRGRGGNRGGWRGRGGRFHH